MKTRQEGGSGGPLCCGAGVRAESPGVGELDRVEVGLMLILIRVLMMNLIRVLMMKVVIIILVMMMIKVMMVQSTLTGWR